MSLKTVRIFLLTKEYCEDSYKLYALISPTGKSSVQKGPANEEANERHRITMFFCCYDCDKLIVIKTPDHAIHVLGCVRY